MSAFFSMGGYAAWVWPSYGITFVVLLLNVYWARNALRRAREEARRRIKMQEPQ